jgi:hypothetical protein
MEAPRTAPPRGLATHARESIRRRPTKSHPIPGWSC